MRVIAGTFRGRTLHTVRGLSVRPATDRVRQSLFDMLTHRVPLDGATVLDLFAGSGSLGIEALSRGAARAVFVEQDRDALDSLHDNLRTLGCDRRAQVVQQDALAFLRQPPTAFDLVFADPPYAFPDTAGLPSLIVGGGWVSRDGYLLIEHTREVTFAPVPACTPGPVKRFGRTIISFFTPINPPPP